MTDIRFYKKKGPFTLAELAAFGQCEVGRGDPTLLITDVAPLDGAETFCISHFSNAKYVDTLIHTKASACVLGAQMVEKAPSHLALLIAKFPYRSYALIANAFYPKEKKEGEIAPTAVIHPTAKLGKGVVIGPMAVIGARVELGDYVEVGPLSVIGEGVVVEENTVIGDHVSLSHALVGKYVHIKPGARVGQSGFGFFMDSGDMGGHVPVPQLGRVIIHDYVEIGANTTVDRGSGADTVIGLGTRIDNLVQVAHNVHFGKGCVMVAQSGIAGSTKFGDYVAAGGQAGFADHLKIGTGARIGAQCGIMRNVEPREVLAGSPAMPLKEHYRQVAVLKRLAEENRKKVN
ncbi:MAG: UDP-3-O-(3-hydroxymyristoyl)glucosamine N-acyltransferase [Alphaproteobacteria bacterium 41-28]|mgnify:CR=1 FL=1|nr:MAG: UDP-3-O-(3-hydroxymyristoyl)glucosamine N-acyltransferase [Alphaproteobacteria bacterium 41-28]